MECDSKICSQTIYQITEKGQAVKIYEAKSSSQVYDICSMLLSPE